MSSDLTVVEQSTTPSTLAPLQTVDVEAAKDFMDNYQDLVEALLKDEDYQEIWTNEGVKKSKKKSAWRKLATAFNISDDVVEKEIIRDECHRIISARYEVMATLPNGRYGVGTGSASIYDKITKKDSKEPTPFELRQRYTNAEHDVISTAHTRAKSRAIADLIGAGENSAEEFGAESTEDNGKPKPKPKPKPSKPENEQAKSNSSKSTKAPDKDDGAIEVEAKEVVVEDLSGDKQSMSFKDLCDSNKVISMAVKELQANEMTVNRESIRNKLLDLLDMSKFSMDEYREAKKLLE